MEDTNEQRDQRLKKLEALRHQGISPYGTRFDVTHEIASLLKSYGDVSKDAFDEKTISCRMAGRVVAMRRFGKAGFASLQEGPDRLQVYFKKDLVGDTPYELYKDLDLGDWIGVEGRLFRTKTDELTVEVHSLTFLSKGLRP